MKKKREHPILKAGLHPRNRHNQRYDFRLLVLRTPELADFIRINPYQDESVDFFNPEAVKTLNRSLLRYYYGIDYWDFPSKYLCPPVPGRVDYIHYMADLLSRSNSGSIPTGDKLKCLDIGTGANCIYPILGSSEYGWKFIGTDIDPVSISSAQKIVDLNPSLKDKIELRLQPDSKHIFSGIMRQDEHFDLTICNPPFHSSPEEANASASRKITNLTRTKTEKPVLNFAGQRGELWCKGGEAAFVDKMILESRHFADSCIWFSTLISKESNLAGVYLSLKRAEVNEYVTLNMEQGNKTSRIVAWTFLSRQERENRALSGCV